MKDRSSTPCLYSKLSSQNQGEVSGILSVGVQSVDTRGTPKAKAAYWNCIDIEERKRGERKGLDTLVVHALNDDN